jgi:hypothetical protein
MSSESVDRDNVGEERVTDFDDPNPGNAPVRKRSPQRSKTDWDKTPPDEE